MELMNWNVDKLINSDSNQLALEGSISARLSGSYLANSLSLCIVMYARIRGGMFRYLLSVPSLGNDLIYQDELNSAEIS